LYRLTSADYLTGDFYHYTYDAVGNRLSEETQLATKNYVYDEANSLASVDGVNYTFDDNGNLLSDGTSNYAYDSANRLISVNGTSSYRYNGLGDRLQQTVNSQTTTYVLDLNARLTQVLSDNENSYLYGLGRISQTNTNTEYFLDDALGSVRQLVNDNAEITLTKSYAPYGEVLSSNGNGTSPFAFTGEASDASGLTYLRARYYNPTGGRFQSRDIWSGNANSPMSFNHWGYVEGNPINLTDPSGYISCTNSNDPTCLEKIQQLKNRGSAIKEAVRIGGQLPVEGFASYVDYAWRLFDGDIRGTLWAVTLTIDGMDANKGAVWPQASVPYPEYWLNFDWLPYENNPAYDKPNWDGAKPWIHSRRGDRRTMYLDKTANQAFHFWYFVGVTFFDNAAMAKLANFVHESGQFEDISLLGDSEAPSPSGKTQQDWNLSYAGIDLGEKLLTDYHFNNYIKSSYCHSETYPNVFSHIYTNPGAWIRVNLKDHQIYDQGR